MKIKNLSFVEKHIEKVVLSVCVLIAAIVTWVFVIQLPYGVKIGNEEQVAPDAIDEQLNDIVHKLEVAINDTKSPLPAMPVVNYTDGFKARIERGLSFISNYESPFGPPGLDPNVFRVTVVPPPEYLLRTPPKPEKLLVRTDFGVLSPEAPAGLLTAVGKPNPPYDFYYATVQATFPMDQWRLNLKTAPEAQRIPEEMWRGSLLMVDVVLQRQTWDASAQRWGDEVTIDPVPGNPSFRVTPASYTHQEASDLVDAVRSDQEEITHPPFPQLAGNRPWLAPDAVEDEKEKAPEKAPSPEKSPSDDKKLRSLNDQIENLNKQITKLSENAGRPGAPGAIGGTPAPGGSGGPGPGSPAGPTGPGAAIPSGAPGARPAPAARSETELNHLRSQLGKLTAERDAIVKNDTTKAPPRGPAPAMPAMPGMPGMPGGMPGMNEAPKQPVVSVAASDLDHVKVWAHDLTVKPGNKYRYRIIANVLNPLFQKPRLAGQQRQKFFHLASLASEPSEWSAEVYIPKPTSYFLVGADKTNQTITIEVWTIFDGAWRPQEFIVRPGDTIGRKVTMTTSENKFQSEVDLHMGVLVVDTDFDAAASKGLAEKTVRAIFLDPSTNKLITRSIEDDANSAERKALKSSVDGR